MGNMMGVLLEICTYPSQALKVHPCIVLWVRVAQRLSFLCVFFVLVLCSVYNVTCVSLFNTHSGFVDVYFFHMNNEYLKYIK